MELLCPSCQKKLTIPDQYAGQLMKCPLCQGIFTAPSLPPTTSPDIMPGPLPAAAPAATPPQAPPARNATTGVPTAIASSGVMPKSSTPGRISVRARER